jgi:preprotein translocase subunit SecD
MSRRTTQLTLFAIFLLTLFSFFIVWPSDPNRYLPDGVPWPKPTCAGPICIGKGVRLPILKFEGSTIGLGHLERREMRLGLDLRGGTRLVLEADITKQPNIDLNDAMNSAVDVVDRRVNEFGVAESIVERVGSNRISVQLPGITAAQAKDQIGKTAQLQFMELARDSDGSVIVKEDDAGTTSKHALSEVLGSNDLIQRAAYVPVSGTDENGVRKEVTGTYFDRSKIFVTTSAAGLPVLTFGMNSDGAPLLKQATTRLSNPPQPMAFFLDGQPLTGTDGRIIAPLVQSPISDQGQITGLNIGTADILARQLRSGSFPVPLVVVQEDDVDATLGDSAVIDSVQGGLIAIVVVMLFMTTYYRLPGVLASAALFVYVCLTLAVYKLFPVTITSAGMAAFVLSVGMAVDANILIFERMKEELRLGRSLVGAIDAGFARAWTSIRDSNIATIIICVILYWFGDQFAASLVKGFALTLILGVLVSMFSAIVVTRTFLRLLVGTTVMQHLSLFGADVVEARGHLSPPPSGPAPAFGGRTLGSREP